MADRTSDLQTEDDETARKKRSVYVNTRTFNIVMLASHYFSSIDTFAETHLFASLCGTHNTDLSTEPTMPSCCLLTLAVIT